MRSEPKKRLGQHFLKDPNIARLMARGVEKGAVVLEVGPGRGALTVVLAEKASFVHAVEVDEEVLPLCKEALAGHENVAIHLADALSFDYGGLEPRPGKLVSNLPYNIASPLVLKLLEEAEFLKVLRFMVQLEVARRMAAPSRVKDYGTYSVLVQLLGRVRVVHRVPPGVFDPPPRVDSAIVEVERGLRPADYEDVKEVVLAAFSSRRKRLANNLKGAWRDMAPGVLAGMGHGESARAEELSPQDFVALYRGLRG